MWNEINDTIKEMNKLNFKKELKNTLLEQYSKGD